MEAVWHDEDDLKISKIINTTSNKVKKRFKDVEKSSNIKSTLEETYNTINSYSKNHNWANIENTQDSQEISKLQSLMLTSTSIIKESNSIEKSSQKNHNYKGKDIQGFISRNDLNQGNQHKSITTNIEFSPKEENICITTGLDKSMKVFSLNSLDNKGSNSESSLVSNIITTDMPIYSSKFLNSNEIILSGRRKHFYIYSLDQERLTRNIFNSSIIKTNTEIKSLERCYSRPTGDSFAFTTLEGDILLFDSKSKQFKSSLKINGSVNSVIVNSNYKPYVYCSSNQGEIFIFDVRKNNSCVNKIDDQGSFNTLCMDIDMEEKYLATSQHTGYVNLYSLDTINYSTSSNVEPIKVSLSL